MTDLQQSWLALRAAFEVADAAVRDTDAVMDAIEEGKILTAGQVLRLYRRRQAAFAAYPGMVADPSWLMLLDLHVRPPVSVSISSACIASQAPPTTALRHIGGLVDHGLVERVRSATDRRTHRLRLTPAGTAIVQASLA